MVTSTYLNIVSQCMFITALSLRHCKVINFSLVRLFFRYFENFQHSESGTYLADSLYRDSLISKSKLGRHRRVQACLTITELIADKWRPAQRGPKRNLGKNSHGDWRQVNYLIT